jgi:hypothetical protein
VADREHELVKSMPCVDTHHLFDDRNATDWHQSLWHPPREWVGASALTTAQNQDFQLATNFSPPTQRAWSIFSTRLWR